MLEKMIKFIWTSYSKMAESGDYSLPTLFFCVLGIVRLLVVARMLLMWESINRLAVVLLTLMLIQLVKDSCVAAEVWVNRLLVQKYKLSRSPEDFDAMVDGMVQLRNQITVYLCALSVPICLIHFLHCLSTRFHRWPQFDNSNCSVSYVVVFLDWAVTTILMLVFYSSPSRFEYRYWHPHNV